MLTEVPKLASDAYESVPTVVGMADVFINNLGFFWNSKASDKHTVLRPPCWKVRHNPCRQDLKVILDHDF